MTVDGDAVAEPGEEDTEDAFEVWDDNWQSLQCFLALETQWNYVTGIGFMKRTGINYPAMDVVLRRMKAEPHVFFDILVMERAAIVIFDEVIASA